MGIVDIKVRPLAPDDWQLYRDMRLASLQHDPGVFFGNYAEESALPPAFWRAELADANDGFLGMFDGDKIVGTVGITTDKGSGFLKHEVLHHPIEALSSVFNAVRQMSLKKAFTCLAESLTGRTAWLGEAFIIPEYRGHHLSKPLYQAGVDWALARPQVNGLMASVRRNNAQSNAAIREHGFSYLYESPFVWPDGTRDGEIVYRIDLDTLRRQPASPEASALKPA